MEVSTSAYGDLGDFMKMVSAWPAAMSASPEQSQSNYWGRSPILFTKSIELRPLGPERLSGNATTPKAIQRR